MEFRSVEELINQAKKDGACKKGIEWAKGYTNLEDLFRDCPTDYTIWALVNRYEQFLDYLDWDKLDGDQWSALLSDRPDLYQYCDWNKLDGYDWMMLLKYRPEFIQYCNWEKLTDEDREYLLTFQPQFKEIYNKLKENNNYI